MKIRTLLISSILLSALFIAAPISSSKKHGGGDSDGHRRKGIELFVATQFAEAIQEFGKASN